MVRKLLAFAVLSLAAASSGLARVAAFVERVALVAVEAVAEPFRWNAPSFSTALPAGPALAYDGPPVHSLRHEAGMSRRAADRHT